MLRAADLVGTWALLTFELVDSDGRVTRRFGDDPVGRLTYTPDGRVWIAFGVRNRTPFASDDSYAGSLEEKARAMDEMYCYCGSYEVGEGTVVHHVDMSLFPNRIGTRQERLVRLDGDTLVLATPFSALAGATQSSRLTWRRLT